MEIFFGILVFLVALLGSIFLESITMYYIESFWDRPTPSRIAAPKVSKQCFDYHYKNARPNHVVPPYLAYRSKYVLLFENKTDKGKIEYICLSKVILDTSGNNYSLVFKQASSVKTKVADMRDKTWVAMRVI